MKFERYTIDMKSRSEVLIYLLAMMLQEDKYLEVFIMETISAMISGACIAAVVYYLFKEGWVSFLAGAIASVFSSIASKSNPEN